MVQRASMRELGSAWVLDFEQVPNRGRSWGQSGGGIGQLFAVGCAVHNCAVGGTVGGVKSSDTFSPMLTVSRSPDPSIHASNVAVAPNSRGSAA